MTMSKFRKVEITMSRGNGYGQYYVHAKYRGKNIKAHTTDSEMWDWLNDDSNKEMHQDAKRRAYSLIKRTYEDSYLTLK